MRKSEHSFEFIKSRQSLESANRNATVTPLVQQLGTLGGLGSPPRNGNAKDESNKANALRGVVNLVRIPLKQVGVITVETI
jgi:hypothetical protein